MKKIDLKKLRVDPVATALADAGSDAMVVRGYVVRAGEDHVAISSSPGDETFIEYPLESIVAAFQDDDAPETTLIVKGDAQVRMIATVTARAAIAPGAGAGGTGCGTTCGSENYKCCCKVGDRCVTGTTGECWCEPALPPAFRPDIGGAVFAAAEKRAGCSCSCSGADGGPSGEVRTAAARPSPGPVGASVNCEGDCGRSLANCIIAGQSTRYCISAYQDCMDRCATALGQTGVATRF